MNKIIYDDKFRVAVTTGRYDAKYPSYFCNFLLHCNKIAEENCWDTPTVINHELKPLGGRLITTSTQGWYLRWDEESSHTAFVLRWA